MARFLLLNILLISSHFLFANHFEKNSMVRMFDLSTKNIKDIQKGDSIFSINLNTKKVESIIVESVNKTTVNESVTIFFSDDSQINVTKTTFLLGNHSWLSLDGDTNKNSILKTEKFNKNDFIVCLNSDSAIQSILIENWKTNDTQDYYYNIEFKNSNNEYAIVVNNVFTSTFLDFFD